MKGRDPNSEKQDFCKTCGIKKRKNFHRCWVVSFFFQDEKTGNPPGWPMCRGNPSCEPKPCSMQLPYATHHRRWTSWTTRWFVNLFWLEIWQWKQKTSVQRKTKKKLPTRKNSVSNFASLAKHYGKVEGLLWLTCLADSLTHWSIDLQAIPSGFCCKFLLGWIMIKDVTIMTIMSAILFHNFYWLHSIWHLY